MPLTVASLHLNEDEFLRDVESCELPLSCFRHGDHLRLAWLYLHRQSGAEALESVRRAIKRLAEAYGVAHIFHETQTRAWVELLATHREETFEEFLALNRARLNKDLLYRFWTVECLASEAARAAWVAPDRAPLPA